MTKGKAGNDPKKKRPVYRTEIQIYGSLPNYAPIYPTFLPIFSKRIIILITITIYSRNTSHYIIHKGHIKICIH